MRRSIAKVDPDTNAALADAAEHLARRGVKFTAIRRSVLRMLRLEQKAIGAYDLASACEKESGRRTAPYAVYRALEFLAEHGLVAHLAGTHAYVSCMPRNGMETSLFFVCSECGVTTERKDPDLERAIRIAASAIGFSARVGAIDIEGVCNRCLQGRNQTGRPG